MNEHNQNSLDRRHFVAAGLGVVAGLAGTGPEAKPQDPLAVAFERYLECRGEWLELSDLPSNSNFDTPEILAVQAEHDMLAEFIATTPPRTVEGACAKIRWALVDMGEFPSEPEVHAPCFRQAIAFLDALI